MNLSNSIVNTYLTCPKKFNLTYIKGLSKPSFKKALSFGTIFHYSINQLYTLGSHSDACYATRKFLLEYEKQYAIKQADIDFIDHIETCVMSALDEWVELFYKKDLERGLKVLEVEKEHKGLRIQNLKTTQRTSKFTFKFTPDMVAELDNDIWLFEYKTAAKKQDRETMISKISMDSQVNAYIHYLEEIYQKRVAGVIYRRFIKPTIRKKKMESDMEFFSRVHRYIDENDCLEEYAVPRDQVFLDHWQNDLWASTKSIERSMYLKHFQKNTTACMNFNSQCEFFEYCSEQKRFKENYEKSVFEMF